MITAYWFIRKLLINKAIRNSSFILVLIKLGDKNRRIAFSRAARSI